ncbi:MAG: glycoside hydrolase [Bacillota bacterium]|nr:glycoside hydrolase [Bacillota bacterium]
MKRYVFIFLAAALIITAIYSNNISIDSYKAAAVDKNQYEDKEKLVLSFIEKNLLDKNGGIAAKLGNPGQNKNTLSESVGILMQYSVLKNRKDIFDRELNFAGRNLFYIPTDSSNGKSVFIKWENGGNKTTCGAAIDDLRIAGALLDAYDKWGSEKYYNMAGFIQSGLYEKQTFDNNLCELYDWKYDLTRSTMPLCYFDFYTLGRLERFNQNWRVVSDKGMSIVRDGFIGKGSPFFYKYYDYKTRKYSMDEESKQINGISLVYVLYTAIHMAESNEDTGLMTQWLKSELSKGKIYAWYNPVTFKPAQNYDNTAVYALAAVYAHRAGEYLLYKDLINKMLGLMITDENSPYYGGFGNAATGEFYSFDNLTALYALGLGGERQ